MQEILEKKLCIYALYYMNKELKRKKLRKIMMDKVGNF